MTLEIQTEAPAAPKKRRTKKRAKARKAAPPPTVNSPFAGITATKCCDGCTPEKCLISMVDICKHPFKTGDSGCGPKTMENRTAARKLVKIKQIEAA